MDEGREVGWRELLRLVGPHLWPRDSAELRARVGEQIALGIPHRDTFMVCDAQDAELVRLLAERVRDDAQRATHRLSEMLYLLTPTGLRQLV